MKIFIKTTVLSSLILILLTSCGAKDSIPSDESLIKNTEVQTELSETVANREGISDSQNIVETIDENNTVPDTIRDVKHTLRFDENGEFRVVMFSDIQSGAPAPQKKTLEGIKTIVDREHPNLVLFGGDNSVGCGSEAVLKKYVTAMTQYLEDNKIPWAHVYGNHDDENALSREKQQKIYESFDYCMSKRGPEDIKGVGNYVIPVYPFDTTRTDPLFAVWGLDSGGYLTDKGLVGWQAKMNNPMFQGYTESGYSYMPFTQIRWYYEASEEIEKFAGHKVPGIMYFHIPLQEFYEVYLNPTQTKYFGEKNEVVGSSPLNSGMFTAIAERGDIKAVSCGHDHINDYSAEYCGIKLCYVSTVSFDTYHDESMMGARVFVVKESEPDNVETYMAYLNGKNLEGVKPSSEVIYDFANTDMYTLDGNGDITDGAMSISGECTVASSDIIRIESGRYLSFKVAQTNGLLKSAAMQDITGNVFTVQIENSKTLYCYDASSEWLTLSENEFLPDNFDGLIAIPASSMKCDSEKLTRESLITGFIFTTDGEVTIDDISIVSKYK